MIRVIAEELPDKDWNDRLLNSGFGTIYQTKEMASYFEFVGEKPIFLKFIKGEEIVGQLLINESSRFKNKKKIGIILKNLSNIQKTIYQWTYGPIIFNQGYATGIYTALGNFLLSHNCKVSGWQHPLLSNDIEVLDQNFKVKMWSTFLIDLQRSKEVVYNDIEKHNGRKNIERSIKRGVEVEELNEKSLLEYHNLKIGMEKGMVSDFSILLKWWNLFKPLGYSGYLARKDGIPVGGLLFSYVNKFMIEGGVVRSEEDGMENLYSQDLIKWKIIEWGIENGMNYYNLAGFNPFPESKKEEGIFKYKQKWGGKRCNYSIISR